MGRPRRRTDYVSIIEACYTPSETHASWLTELLQTAEPALNLGGGLGLSLVREGANGRTIALSDGVGQLTDMLRHSWPVIQGLDEATYRRFYYPRRPIALASSLVRSFAPEHRRAFADLMNYARCRDLLGMLGYPAPGWAFALFVAIGESAQVRGSLRETLQRLRIHVEASLRLRLAEPAVAVAVIRPDGRIEHLVEPLHDEAGGRELVARAKQVEHARTRQGRADPERALGVWRALVEGRWTLVERHDSDGRRSYHAFENAPALRQRRALTEIESSILELSLRGLTGKEVAYALGLSQTRVSLSLARAAERLGFRSRAELMSIGAEFTGEPGEHQLTRLTHAEREVLALVQQGMSNHAIAEARQVSVRTVANQLASLLRKTGASSRRGLLVWRVPPP